MSGWLIDTNVLSELRRKRPDQAVRAFMAEANIDTLFVSVVNFAEIRYGILTDSDPVRRLSLDAWLANTLRPLFAGRVLPVTEDIMLAWRLMVATARRQNHTFPEPDLIIAATALQHGLTIVTRNTADFTRAGVPVFNPWSVITNRGSETDLR